ncbi:hypothetical protein [uncultured Nitrosomonas sp.]|uniref:hypothetical protein n=1 Tax=uncultured Nitrosomonas sp. TaxID=156424 RepID=UPI00262A4235|nr:hypothetical protein [uncultured Nitrosomonas sp.]
MCFLNLCVCDPLFKWLSGWTGRPDEIWTNAVSRAEIKLGLALMPEGKRQKSLSQAARAMFDEDFAGRCLPFDEIAASYYGRIVSTRIRIGRPISVEDAQIAAIALATSNALVYA